MNEVQRYRCANATCGRNFTAELRGPSEELKEKIFDLHFLDGLSNRAIGKQLGISDVTIGKWRKKYHL